MTAVPEFSRLLPVDRLGCQALSQTVTAMPEECDRVAARLRIEAVSGLAGEFSLRCGVASGLYEATGTARATVTQLCVVSGEPFTTEVSTPVTVVFSDGPVSEELEEAEGWDDIEQIDNGMIDLGELTVQYLSLSLDPYPRKPGMDWMEGDEAPLKPESPFAVLKGLKKDN